MVLHGSDDPPHLLPATMELDQSIATPARMDSIQTQPGQIPEICESGARGPSANGFAVYLGRGAALSDLHAARRQARRIAMQAARHDPDIQVAQLATQLCRQGLSGPGARLGRGNAGRVVTKADLDAATPEMQSSAADIADPAITEIRALRARVDATIEPKAKASAEATLVDAAAAMLSRMQAQRKAARRDYVRARTHESQASAKVNLVVARLAIRMFKQATPQVRPYGGLNLSTLPTELRSHAEATVKQLQEGLLPLREALSTARGSPAKQLARQALKQARMEAMARLEARRAAARAAVDAATSAEERQARIPTLHLAKATKQLFRQTNQQRVAACQQPRRTASHL